MSRVLVWLAIFPRILLALDPNKSITQYSHTTWRVQEGFLPGGVTALAQTKDGYLWIGTQSGLFRFDGVRFTQWTAPAGSMLPDPRIYKLLAARDGGLWIGTGSGFAEWKDGSLRVYAAEGRFGALIQDREGTIWAGHTRRASVPPLCRVDGRGVRCFGEADGLPIPFVAMIHEDSKGNLWIAGSTGACRWKPSPPDLYKPGVLKGLDNKQGVTVIGTDVDGTLWMNAASAGIGRFIGARWQPFHKKIVLHGSGLLLDRDNGFWIGTENDGLLRSYRGRLDRFTRNDGLPSNSVTDMLEDREGNLWVGTSFGLNRFRDVSVASVTEREGLSNGFGLSVTPSKNGSVWIGLAGGQVNQFQHSLEASFQIKNSLRPQEVTSMLEDSKGRLWMGADNDLLWREGGRLARVSMPDRSLVGIVLAIAEDRSGDIWAGSITKEHALLRIRDGSVLETFPESQFGAQVRSLLADPNGDLWIGLSSNAVVHYHGKSFRTYTSADGLGAGGARHMLWDSRGVWVATGSGLSRFENGRFETLTAGQGLPCNSIDAMVKADDDSLWLRTICGLVRIDATELEAWARHSKTHIEARLLDVFDGVQAGNGPFSPRAARSGDGRLWFITEQGIQVLDPRRVKLNALVPPVVVEALKVRGKEMAVAQRATLAPNAQDIEIDYAALSLSIPEKVRFRYKLEGADAEWQDAGTRRQALYNRLPPNNYRFRVTACNNDGLWNVVGASMDFSIAPAFYQTNWFRSACILASAALMWLLYRLRLQQMTGQMDLRYRERLAERTRIARELHDTLLQSLAGVSLQLDGISKKIASSPEAAASQIGFVRDQVDSCFREARLKVWNLRSPELEDQGLSATLGAFVENVRRATRASCHFTLTGSPRRCSPDAEEELLRIVQEATNNAVRHANSSRIDVHLAYEDLCVVARVSDDGCGFNFEDGCQRHGHWGLKNMRERAAQIDASYHVATAPGRGTQVEVRMNLSKWSRHAHNSLG